MSNKQMRENGENKCYFGDMGDTKKSDAFSFLSVPSHVNCIVAR